MPVEVSDKHVVVLTVTQAELQSLIAQKAFDTGAVPFVADHVILSQQSEDQYLIKFEKNKTGSPLSP